MAKGGGCRPSSGGNSTGEVILWAMRWYCRYGVSYRALVGDAGRARCRGRPHHDLPLGPALCARAREAHGLVPEPDFVVLAGRRDETYVRGHCKYLYWAIEKGWATLDWLSSSGRNRLRWRMVSGLRVLAQTRSVYGTPGVLKFLWRSSHGRHEVYLSAISNAIGVIAATRSEAAQLLNGRRRLSGLASAVAMMMQPMAATTPDQ